MSTGKRPGGLTALAVFNFIFGALELISALALVALLRFADAAKEGASSEEQAIIDAFQSLGTGMFAVIVLASLVAGVLLIVSGIGYLKLKSFLGRTLGNTYALLGLISAIATGALLPAELGGGFSITTIVNLLYPALTLFLLNVVFKEDFTN